MKRGFLVFFYFITLLCLPFGAYADLPRTVIVSCDDWAGYCNHDGSGWYLDILREVYGEKNIQIKLKSEPFARGLESVKSGSADLILTGFNIPERQRDFTLSSVRIDNEQTIIAYYPPTVYSPEHLAAARVAYVRGVAYQDHFKPKMKLVEVTRRTQAVDMLVHRRVDYFMAELTETLQAIDELHLSPSSFRFERIDVKPLYVMFQKNDVGQALARIYDEGIATLYQQGRPQALAKKYQVSDFSVYFPEVMAIQSASELAPRVSQSKGQ